VDDVAETREVLAEMLRRIGVAVRMAGDGQEALEQARARPPDVIFMDFHMPGMDGEEAMRRIREERNCKQVKIAAVSASVLRHEQEQVVAAGFDAFIGKPIQAGQLYACLADLLGVEYEYVGPTQAEADVAGEGRVELSEALAERLRRAAALYHVTELRRCMREVEALGPPGQRLAARLRERAEAYDMEGVLRVLEGNDENPA